MSRQYQEIIHDFIYPEDSNRGKASRGGPQWEGQLESPSGSSTSQIDLLG